MPIRCSWAEASYPLLERYHDEEWGVPLYDDNKLFEFLILEGAQAGLSWQTVLNKRSNYRQALANFNPARVARFSPADINQLLQNVGLIRNRLKLESAITNAQKFIDIQIEFGSFSNYQWAFVKNKPIQNSWQSVSQVPATSPQAEAFSKDLKRRGFSFVGPTIIYAHMQAVGMVNDHVTSCFRYKALNSS